MQISKPIFKKVLGLVIECWPSLRSVAMNSDAPCQQQTLFPSSKGWQHLRLLGFRCLQESYLGYEFEITLEGNYSAFWQIKTLELQTQNSFSKIALWLTSANLSGCQLVPFQGKHLPLCQALASVDLLQHPATVAFDLSTWLNKQGLLPGGRFTILQGWQHSESVTLHCRTTDCLSRACYNWLQQQAIRYQLIYVRGS